MSDQTTRDQLPEAARAVATMLRGLDGPDLDGPTPCKDWDLRALAKHALGTTTGLAAIGRKDELGGDPWAGPDVAERWNLTLADNVAAIADAWNNDEAWSGTVHIGAELPAATIGDMAYAEILLHGWDVSRAVGTELRVDDATAAVLHRTIEETAELGRSMGAYGEQVELPADAGDFDQALAAAGRDPSWRPA